MSVNKDVKSTPKALQVMFFVLSAILFLLVCAWAALSFVAPAFRPPKAGLVTLMPTGTPQETPVAPVSTQPVVAPATATELAPEVSPPSATAEASATVAPTGTATLPTPSVSAATPAVTPIVSALPSPSPTGPLAPSEEAIAQAVTATPQPTPRATRAEVAGSPTPTPSSSPTPTESAAPATPTQPMTETPEMAGAISETTILVTTTPATASATPVITVAPTLEPSATATPVPIHTATTPPTRPPTGVPSRAPGESPTPPATIEPTWSPTPTALPSPTLTSTPGLPATLAPLPPTPAPPTVPAAPGPQPGSLVVNGDFEQGLQSTGVAVGWQSFNNAGAEFSFQPRDWEVISLDGQHSQFMRIRKAQQPDRYLGIYQTMFVVPGATYTFSIEGAIRSEVGDVNLSQYGYRLQVSFDLQGAQSWKAVDNWIELPWDEQPRQPQTLRIDRFTTQVTPVGDKLTIFIRAWKKWADEYEGAYNVDNIRLEGPAPGTLPQAQPGAQGVQPDMARAEQSAVEADRPVQALFSANVSAPVEMHGPLTADAYSTEAPEASQMVAPAEMEGQPLVQTPTFQVATPRPGAGVSVPAQSEVQAPAQPQLEARPVPVTGDGPPEGAWSSARVYTTMALLFILIASASWRMLWTRI